MINEHIQITEQDLQLIVSEKTLGTLTTNARQIKSVVEQGLSRYNINNYNDGNIDEAKKDKAMLNGAAKSLNDKRIEFEKEFMKPFAEFKDVVNDTVTLIKECSSQIDEVVKLSDQKFKEQKRDALAQKWETLNFTLVSFEKVFDDRWLNKTASEKAICSEMCLKIDTIKSDLGTIESLIEIGLTQEDCDTTKAVYLDKLNLSEAIAYAKRLKDNREAIRSAKEPKEHLDTAIYKAPVSEPVAILEAPKQFKPVIAPELLTRSFRVTATRDGIIALGNFMNANGIFFEKI